MDKMSYGLCLGGLTQTGTMISNLPLLFADGYPTCLDKITVDQLEKFVPFMIKCSSGIDSSQKLTAPKWWPKDLEFCIPLVRPPGLKTKWLAVLKSLVCRCYSYHSCEFMLRFCTDLSQCPTSQLTFVNSWDGTTSLYNKDTGRLLVTFKNENMTYDKKKESPRKTLLPWNDVESGRQQAMVQPSVLETFLCDHCDEKFNTLKEIEDHERVCCMKFWEPSPVLQLDEFNTDQEKFLNYFCLACTTISKSNDSMPYGSENPCYKRSIGNPLRYSAIPLSSPLGALVQKRLRSAPIMPSVQLERAERYCSGKLYDTISRFRESKHIDIWPVTWKPRKRLDDDDENWVHTFKFPHRQWRRIHELNARSRKLLRRCRRVRVKLRRLTAKEIDIFTHKTNIYQKKINVFDNKKNIYEKEVTALKYKNDLCQKNSVENQDNECKRISPHKLLSSLQIINNLESIDDVHFNENDSELTFPTGEECSNIKLHHYTLGTQLIPNTLYMYDRNLATTPQPVDILEHKRQADIPLIDLCSSDEETDTTSTVRDHHSETSQSAYSSLQRSSYELITISKPEETSISLYESQVVSNGNYYRSDLPHLMHLLQSHVDYCPNNESDQVYINNINENGTLSVNSSKQLFRNREAPACQYNNVRKYNSSEKLSNSHYEEPHCSLIQDYNTVGTDVSCPVSKPPNLPQHRRGL